MTVDFAPQLLEDTPIGPTAGGLYRRQNVWTGLAAGIFLGFVAYLISHATLEQLELGLPTWW